MSKFSSLFSKAIDFCGGGFFGKLVVFVAVCLLLPLIQKIIRSITKNPGVNTAAGVAGCVVWAAFFTAAGLPTLGALFAFLALVASLITVLNLTARAFAAI